MRVLFFQPYLASWRIDFLERFIREFRGDVIVVDGGHREAKDDKSVSSNSAPFEVIRLKSANRIFSSLGFPYPVYFSFGIFKTLRMYKPDVVVTEGEINIINNIPIFIYSLIYRKKYLWWSLGKVRTRKVGLLPRLLRPLVSVMIAKCKYIIARNTLAKKYYIEQMGVRGDAVVVAPNSMNEEKARLEVDFDLLEKLRTEKSGPVILYVGAMTLEKRPADLIAALKILDRRSEDFATAELWYVGDGSEREAVVDAAVRAGLEERVRFFGRVIEGVGSYFSVADVVVVPGLGGLVINHAMIFGVPVVSRVADGTEHDLIEAGRTGYIVEDESNDALAEAIRMTLAGNSDGVMSRHVLNKIESEWNMRIMIERFTHAILN